MREDGRAHSGKNVCERIVVLGINTETIAHLPCTNFCVIIITTMYILFVRAKYIHTSWAAVHQRTLFPLSYFISLNIIHMKYKK